jgi:endoglucanase
MKDVHVMNNRYRKLILLFAIIAVLLNESPAQEAIRLNQTGFYPQGPKYAVAVEATGDVFYLTSPDLSDTLLSGPLAQAEVWSHSAESVRLIDFSDFQQPGTYTIVIPDLGQSYPFEIADYVLGPLVIGALKSYYYQRASTALPEQFAGIWQRPAGHPDNQVRVHGSAASADRPLDTIISAPGGWYDAGDYNKYIVNSGISTYTILAAYEHFPGYFQNLKYNIPESSNDLPDILDEALWNLRWMLTMQEPSDGGVYHKLTTANFSGMVMPHQATATRYVVRKSTPASLDFAAVMAQAGRIFTEYEQQVPGFADSCLTAALAAWRWARKNPDVSYNQGAVNSEFSPAINTGEYGDGNFNDEFQWASAELFITTKEDSFLFIRDPLSGSFGVPWWGGVNTLGLYSLIFHREDIANQIDTTQAINYLLSIANSLTTEVISSAYHIAMGQSDGNFGWGSNGGAANQGMALIQAYNLTGNNTYLEAALHNCDYLLGRNAVGYSFMTGYGDKTPLHPHHRQSQSDGIAAPVPGLLAGGPNPGMQDGCQGYLGENRANAYVDDVCSYASNENAINWNAPFVYLLGALEASYSATGEPSGIAPPGSRVLPRGFGFNSNYPNPFNPSTHIVYSLPEQATIELAVYNSVGQRIRTLEKGLKGRGIWTVSWDGRTAAGQQSVSAVYIVRLNAWIKGKQVSDSHRIVLIR